MDPQYRALLTADLEQATARAEAARADAAAVAAERGPASGEAGAAATRARMAQAEVLRLRRLLNPNGYMPS